MDASSDTYNAVLDMLATSSSHDSGSDPKGENPVVKPTPLDAHAHVKLDSRGKLVFSTESIADENKELRDMVKDLQSQLLEAKKSPKDQPEPSPTKNAINGGLGDILSEEQFDLLCKSVGAQIVASIRSGQDKVIPNVPHLYSDASGQAKALSSQLQVSGKGSTRASQKDILGTSMGPLESEEELDDVSSEEQDEG